MPEVNTHDIARVRIPAGRVCRVSVEDGVAILLRRLEGMQHLPPRSLGDSTGDVGPYPVPVTLTICSIQGRGASYRMLPARA